MAKVFIEESTLTAIGDAIRGKEGTTALIPTTQMASRISAIQTGGGGEYFTDEDLTFTGYLNNALSGKLSQKIIETEGTRIRFYDIAQVNYCFNALNNGVDLSHLTMYLTTADMTGAFANSSAGYLPALVGSAGWIQSSMFAYCYYLRALPEGLDTLDFSTHNEGEISSDQHFCNCFSLLEIPEGILPNFRCRGTYQPLYYYGFSNCYVLDALYDLPVWEALDSWNQFDCAFNDCSRLKTIKFETNADGSPKTAMWDAQCIDLTICVGYTRVKENCTGYNSGLTDNTFVRDIDDYNRLKDDPEYFTTEVNFSRYTHRSAVETINSLPDTSGYGSNMIMFNSESGRDTDEGAVGNLTWEEIAVAADKGWTVSV